jgi:transposase
MDVFMQGVSETFKGYRIIMAMDSASWHTGDKTKKWENIVPLFQPPYSPELNPVEHIWHHIRETHNFKNRTFNSMQEVEDKLAIALNQLDKETVKSISQFKWIYEAI